MEIKITLFITIMLYSVVTSQSFFYMLAMSDTMKNMQAATYIESRKLLDKNLLGSLQPIYYLTLAASFALVVFCVTNPSGMLFICAIIALILLLVDSVLAIKGNIPLNKIFNSWTASAYPDNWKEYQSRWFTIYNVRQAANILGFLVLVSGLIFGM
jgi:hypothetical protein